MCARVFSFAPGRTHRDAVPALISKRAGRNLRQGSLLILIFVSFQVFSQGGHETTHILFLGNSYFDWDFLPGMFENLCIASGKNVDVDQYIPSGKSLDFHASSPYTHMKIYSRDWDFIVMIGSSAFIAYPDSFAEQPVNAALPSGSGRAPSTRSVMLFPDGGERGTHKEDGYPIAPLF